MPNHGQILPDTNLKPPNFTKEKNIITSYILKHPARREIGAIEPD